MDPLKKALRRARLNVTRYKPELISLLSKTIDLEVLSKIEAAIEAEWARLKDDYEETINRILDLLDDDKDKDEIDKLMTELMQVRQFNVQVLGKVKLARKKIEKENPRESLLPGSMMNSTLATSAVQPKLEKIQVPKFHGNPREFFNFKALFCNLVHDSADLDNVQKLHYLKEALKGDAACVVKDFDLTGDAYPEAWAHVLERYENKRLITRLYYRDLESLQPIKHESGIRSLLNNVNSAIRGLKISGETVDPVFSRYLAYKVSTCLDDATRREWEISLPSDGSIPSYDQLHKFLQVRCFAFEERDIQSQEMKKVSKVERKSVSAAFTAPQATKQVLQCVACSQPHRMITCDKFIGLKPEERFALIKKSLLCTNCFNSDHTAFHCQKSPCHLCGKKHHKLLHFVSKEPIMAAASTTPAASASEPSKRFSNVCFNPPQPIKTILLPTAVVNFHCGRKSGKARVMLDSCSQLTLISDKFVRKYRLLTRESSAPLSVSGIGGSVISTRTCSIILSSRFHEFSMCVEAEVIPSSAMSYSVRELYVESLKPLFAKCRNELADSALMNSPADIVEVDLIIGAEYYQSCLSVGSHTMNDAHLQNTVFGWTFSGSVSNPGASPLSSVSSSSFTGFCTQQINQLLEKFWSLEEASPSASKCTSEDEECDQHFEKTYRRDSETGKFIVRLPFNSSVSKLTSNYKAALVSWYRVEKSLKDELKTSYNLFLEEYEQLGHMTRVSSSAPRSNEYFAPHRAVQKPESVTTKLRVVFNASSKTPSGVSLNDALLKGPILQPELFDILVAFREHTIAFTADIEKMYRCIMIDPGDRRFQKIIWRRNLTEALSEYELNTVTYGMKPSSFIATKCLTVVARELRESDSAYDKIAANFIDRSFYMDDLLAGADSVADAVQLQKSIHLALSAAGFPLRKYRSNSNEFLTCLNASSIGEPVIFDHADVTSVLGLTWDPTSDSFLIKTRISTERSAIVTTKRVILSEIARIFDPLGFMSPVSVRAKVILQSLWREQLEWDAPVSAKLSETYKSYKAELSQLDKFRIQRRYPTGENRQLIGYCDASERAYCAVLYVRVELNDHAETYFVCAKTKVAPIKALTIPKLELEAAVLLAKLLLRVSSILKIDRDQVCAFSDSTVVLAWVKNQAELKVYERNRVSKIVHDYRITRWSHVKSAENPADLATRGITVAELISSHLWLRGPSLLSSIEFRAPEPLKVAASWMTLSSSQSPKKSFIVSLLDRLSEYNRLVHTVAYILRWLKSSDSGPLSTSEVRSAINRIISAVQVDAFGVDPIRRKSLASLLPFIDNVGIVRIQGRLENAELSYEMRHPILLPATSRYVELYVRHLHLKYFHATQSFLVNFVRSQFWVINGLRRIVKKVVRTCVICIRYRAETYAQCMGNLPVQRVTPSRPFSTTGVDIMGPFTCKCLGHRSVKHTKIYAAIFVCFSTRAVHLELVSSLTSESFLDCLRRFIARRGMPTLLYSDNGTNFIGANNVLTRNFATDSAFEWRFIPPRSPNFGGLWESAVKSSKHHLRRCLNGAVGTSEQYMTFFCQIEAVLNSRPLCSRKQCSDAAAITPAHFLVGSSLLTPDSPTCKVIDQPLEPLAKSYQTRLNSFWKFWRYDYLSLLQHRNKWTTANDQLNVGSVVILKEDNVPPAAWKLGLVTEAFPDKSGSIRTVTLKTANSTFVRTVRSLILLPPEC